MSCSLRLLAVLTMVLSTNVYPAYAGLEGDGDCLGTSCLSERLSCVSACISYYPSGDGRTQCKWACNAAYRECDWEEGTCEHTLGFDIADCNGLFGV